MQADLLAPSAGRHGPGAAGTAAFAFQFAQSGHVAATDAALFDHLDDPRRLSAHMAKSSWMMLGSKMEIELDDAGGRDRGALIRLRGRVLGIPLDVKEEVTERLPPSRKVWETKGTPRLLIIGSYRMGFEIDNEAGGSHLTVFIDYDLPGSGLPRLLGWLFGASYAKWCVRRMIADATANFRSISREKRL